MVWWSKFFEAISSLQPAYMVSPEEMERRYPPPKLPQENPWADMPPARPYPGEALWSVSQGCVCPPTSEQTCQNPQCPRKPAQPAKG